MQWRLVWGNIIKKASCDLHLKRFLALASIEFQSNTENTKQSIEQEYKIIIMTIL